MTRIKTSKWPTALFAGLAVVLMSSTASATETKIWTVDCFDGETIADALSHARADRVDEIHFTGTCYEELDFNTGNVTITGDDVGEIVGHVSISGASNVILHGFNLGVGDDSDTGVKTSMGASVRITGVTIEGTGVETLGIHVERGSVARIDHVTVTVAGTDATALLVKGGATARLNGGSTFTGVIAIEVVDASSLDQGGDIDTVHGPFDIAGSSYGRLREVNLIGDLSVSRLSGLRMTGTTAGSVDLSWGSFARLDGGNVITGGVSCSQGSQVQDRRGVGAPPLPPPCTHP